MSFFNAGASREAIQFNTTSSINGLKLISEVKKYRLLYDDSYRRHKDSAARDELWQKVYVALCPNYQSLSRSAQSVTKQAVRKKWKSLRTVFAREVRNEFSKNPIVRQMEFLLPFLKGNLSNSKHTDSIQKQRYNKEKGNPEELRDTASVNGRSSPAIQENVEEKPSLQNVFCEKVEKPYTSTVDQVRSFDNGYCLTQCCNGEFLTSVTYTESEIVDISESERSYQQTCSELSLENHRKLPEENIEFEEELYKLLTNIFAQARDKDQLDADRLFLLSLVSDMKSIPANKKMLVKADIVTALARGSQ